MRGFRVLRRSESGHPPRRKTEAHLDIGKDGSPIGVWVSRCHQVFTLTQFMGVWNGHATTKEHGGIDGIAWQAFVVTFDGQVDG